MQASLRSSAKGTGLAKANRSAALARPVPFSSKAGSRTTSVKVYAKKGQKGRMGLIPGQAEMIRVDPPTPEVDPENAEFVVFIRAKDYMDEKMKVMMRYSPWVPLTIVKGGQAANFLVKAMENEWGRKLYAKTLVRNIGQAVYKDRESIEKGFKTQYPALRAVPSANFEYAMKIRDKSVPKDWFKAEDMTVFPAESEMQGTALDELKKFFSVETFSGMFAGNASSS